MSKSRSPRDPKHVNQKRSTTLMPGDTTLVPDPFVEISITTWTGLRHAVLECGWIADGGDPSATQPDRDLASLRRIEYERERVRVMERNLAFLAKKLSVNPPSPADIAAARELTEHLARMRDVNVKVSAIISAATNLLDTYNKTNA